MGEHMMDSRFRNPLAYVKTLYRHYSGCTLNGEPQNEEFLYCYYSGSKRSFFPPKVYSSDYVFA